MTSIQSPPTSYTPLCTIESSLRHCRIVALILAFTILVVGLLSHYRSSWVSLHFKNYNESVEVVKFHELCEVKYFYGNCPDIILEQFFVAVISVSFIFSMLSVLSYCLWYRGTSKGHPLKWWDLIYHAVTALVLLVAAVVYLISALQIQEFSGGVAAPTMNFRTEEKIAAVVLTIIQAGLHVTIVVLVGRCRPLVIGDDPEPDFNLTTFANGDLSRTIR